MREQHKRGCGKGEYHAEKTSQGDVVVYRRGCVVYEASNLQDAHRFIYEQTKRVSRKQEVQ
jgi:hypothetical protein